MKYKNIAFIILIFILSMAFIIAGTSSKYVLKGLKNVNEYVKLESYEKQNINKQGLKEENYIVIYDSKEPNSIEIKENTVKMLNYMRKNAVIYDASEPLSLNLDIDGCIVCCEYFEKINSIEDIFNYAAQGGSVLFAERPLDSDFLKANLQKLGINSTGGIIDSVGVNLLSNIMIKAKNVSFKGDFITNSSLDTKLNDESILYASDKNNVPLLWQHKLDKGKVIVFNGTMFNEKNNRGLLTAAISLLKEDFIYPIMNLKLVYIDDFPSPVPLGKEASIYVEFGRNIEKFYREIWWVDLLKYAKLYDLKYNGMIIETYNDNTSAPFEPNKSERDRKNFVLYSRELIRSGGELGIHGYNHQSLAPEGYIKEDLGYKSWKSEVDMLEALKEVMNYSKNIYSQYDFRSYVPPSNILSPEGRNSILKGTPNIKIISSVYTSDYYGDSYTQEFEVSKDGIIELPRLTAGYFVDEELFWTLYNGVNSLGVVSHFVHPDDVLDAKRSTGKGWGELSREFSSIFKTVKEKYPWLRAVKVSDGAEELKNYLEVKPYFNYKKDRIEGFCDNFRKDSYFILRTKKAVKSFQNCEVNSIDEGIYIVKVKSPQFTVLFR